ncbi:Na(+)-translocating NADH-quinone reductase subunit A [Porticoccaceae bacterium]|jgi:Na+-transporting NADH:ubiquinone oxidoreductase subunit A|nr:Na(+)-translocating NADH-quinone reductase subunit A [Porticoccaceae bacterium]MDC1476540.1 Na(+)-translocating NADH-quinone reductase subunit A [Porticoccaceae bacterium]CAI8310183.1 MAG: Na(+)-translocating NADH-quinone reductase subunit A [SAR92 bacterium MED-G29]|tara:strand:+ start:7520 stop:8860 length:1341 start_codon:yes stop_codon:yes gene_type:complete
MIKVRRGLDLPIAGAPEQVIQDGPKISQVAVVGSDYPGMKPTMVVREGDRVTRGQALFTDKKNEGVVFTAPAAGIVVAINRGERRVFQSLVIDTDGDKAEKFKSYKADKLATLDRAAVVNNLVSSGQWVALRTRPYSKVPAIDSTPASIFVTAMDTNPLSADPAVIIAQRSEDFINGLTVLTRLTDGPVNLCVAPDSGVVGHDIDGVREISFSGPHPAGLPGTHIHHVDPVSADKTVWSIGYQDVIATGALFTSGKLDNSRVVSLAGPQVLKPRLVSTCVGANLNQLVIGELANDENRVISGSVLAGRKAAGEFAYLGRYHNQVSVIREGREREFLHYLRAGVNKHSALPLFISSLSKKLFNMTSSTNGSERAMVPVGGYEDVTALDILPVQLLRSLIVGDTEMAQKLGCLELDEEDVGLYTYVCVGKYEYGGILRDNLTRIEKEG